MKVNKWTLGLAAVGLVTLPSLVQAEEKASSVMTALSSTSISGYVDTSAQWNPGTGNANPPAFSYNKGKQDGFNLNAVKLTIEKPLDEGQWAAGYKADLLFGPDANQYATTSSGTSSSDFAIKQAYVQLRAPVGNGLDFKMGVFDTIVGYETFDSVNNPNYTRSYGFTIEPTTHTGLLATYQFHEGISASAGVANTTGPTINQRANPPRAESSKTYMGSIALTAPKDWGWMAGSVLYAGIVSGFSSTNVSGNLVNYYAGLTANTPIKELKTGLAFDYQVEPFVDDKLVFDFREAHHIHRLNLPYRAIRALTGAGSWLNDSRVTLMLSGSCRSWSKIARAGPTARTSALASIASASRSCAASSKL